MPSIVPIQFNVANDEAWRVSGDKFRIHLAQLIFEDPSGPEGKSGGRDSGQHGNFLAEGALAIVSLALFIVGFKLIGKGIDASGYDNAIALVWIGVAAAAIFIASGILLFAALPATPL